MLSDLDNGRNLYLQVRVAFLTKGSSLHAWCHANQVAMPNARAAFLGTWSGPKASQLVARIMKAAGLE